MITHPEVYLFGDQFMKGLVRISAFRKYFLAFDDIPTEAIHSGITSVGISFRTVLIIKVIFVMNFNDQSLYCFRRMWT